MVDQRMLRKRLLKQARKLGFKQSRRGGFSVKFLQDWIKKQEDTEELKKALIDQRDSMKKQGGFESILPGIEKQISELETTSKSRGTQIRQVRHQRERRNR